MADSKTVPVVWVGVEDAPISPTNTFISQFQGDLFFLTFGLLSPPVFLGTNEQKLKQLEEMSVVPVTPMARLAITPSDFERLIGVLQENLENYKRDAEQASTPE